MISSYGLFQSELLRHPDKGDVIPQSGGLRKVRMRLPGRGKSGGARVIYLHLPKHDTIVLFYLYTKAQRENLSARATEGDSVKRRRLSKSNLNHEEQRNRI